MADDTEKHVLALDEDEYAVKAVLEHTCHASCAIFALIQAAAIIAYTNNPKTGGDNTENWNYVTWTLGSLVNRFVALGYAGNVEIVTTKDPAIQSMIDEHEHAQKMRFH